MDLSATQIFEDGEDFLLTQEISRTLEEEDSVQVGTLSVGSTDHKVKTGITKIGRHDSCNIIIKDATVSKLHAEIEASRGGSTWISDLKSSNNTKLNNFILRPTRWYELKDGSVIELGKVRATYRTYSTDTGDIVIPETPAPPRQKVASTIIPNTPDSSLNNSSGVDDDGSVILGTQKDENSVFRRPRVPQLCQSTSSSKSNTSMNESNDSRIAMNTSDVNVGENQFGIFDTETQTCEERCEMPSSSIHDMETQGIPKDVSEQLVEANTEVDEQPSELNVDKTNARSVKDIHDMETQNVDKTNARSVKDIHDMETQNYMDYKNEMEKQRSEINIQNVTKENFTDVRIAEIHDCVSDTGKGGGDTQKSEFDKKRQKNVSENIGRDIQDLETQKFDDKCFADNVSKTQFGLDDARCEQNGDISNMETQFITDGTSNETNNRANNEINRENITGSPKSRSSSPGSLNLSSPGVDDCPSPLNQSDHLLESSDLLEFYGEGIDKEKEIHACCTSTPKPLTKQLSERDSNVGNVDTEENNDEDMFEAPTQRLSRFEASMSDYFETNEEGTLAVCKVLKKKRRSEQTNNDSEIDTTQKYIAGHAKKQRESSGTLNKPSNEDANRSDPGTNVESEDMFDAATQLLNNSAAKDTSSINQPQETNEINRADDIESTQIRNNVNQDNQIDTSDINEASTQLILSHKTSKTVDRCTTELPDCEDIDYELAPTQVIGEIEDKEGRSSTREGDSSKVNLNDTLEQKLNEMFEDINNDVNNVCELPCMSTQCLEDILEHGNSASKSIADNRNTDKMPQKQVKKGNQVSCNQQSHNLLNTEINDNNVNNSETESQKSDTRFSTITTRRKRNILKDTQEFVKDVTPRQNVNSLQASAVNNEKAVDDDTTVESKRRKIISKAKNTSESTTETLNDDNGNKNISSGDNERSVRSLRSTRQKNVTTPETSKQVSGRDPAKLEADDTEENTSACVPCSSASGQCLQTLNPLYEMDDDILTRLPAVRISGTLSYPASPSASSMSSVRSTRSKRSTSSKRDLVAKGKRRKSSRGKSLRKRNVGNSRENDKPPADGCPSPVLNTSTIVKVPDLVDTSEDSETDSETERFQQMAGRMLSKFSGPKGQDEGSGKNTCVLSDVSEDPGQSTNIESRSLTRARSRTTRHFSKQSNENSRDLQRKTRLKSAACEGRSTEPETKFTVKRKISLNVVEENAEKITLNKCKPAQDTEKCPTSAALEKTRGTSSNTDGSVHLERSNVKRSRYKIDDGEVTDKLIHVSEVTASGNTKKNEPAQRKGMETRASESQEKVLRVLLTPIKSPMDDESQEVERIMVKGPSQVQDKNLSIRESSKAKLFRRGLRTRRRSNSDTKTYSGSSESGMSSEIGDSSYTGLINPEPRVKRRRAAKSSISSTEAQVSRREKTFKRPTQIKNSSNLASSFSIENTISESSQSSTESFTSTNSRVSRSRAASIREKEKAELNQNTNGRTDESASGLNASVEITSFSTPRTRRSTSILNNSTPSAIKHKVLFTGIMEDYSKIVKTLGGSKVEDPAKSTILVTDKVRRTYKFLCALAKGVPIVAIDWLKDSETAARFLDCENFMLKDPAAEAKFGFRLRKSLDKAKGNRLLDGYVVVLTPNVAPPPIEELKNIVSSCGGKALLRPPIKWPERAVILSCEEDLPNARKFLSKAPKTVTVQSTEFILTGILRQEMDFEKYKLT
ncbi:PREDICTED: uncharacterized protein LOC105557314 isoform X2 [Vollenhovia emeryi]|nr:PREDICTED: uncharacterized protein LOC105557314 isoform X2 [Vollenhovia emeryi]XP_011859904.1 PREDICTED: uncharacterized protein LOC105557314 isoform X2 [Vollenhovia emeryi]XP_011859905.1 PREDICTED: uncharacterized protein LOC105557314 isoform X2 [Vollenhovia emeryi]